MQNIISAIMFTSSQIITIIIVCAVLAAMIALNAVLIYVFRKRGERKLCTLQLQLKREELLRKLDDLKSGDYAYEEEQTAQEEQSAEEEQPVQEMLPEEVLPPVQEEPEEPDDSDEEDEADDDDDEEGVQPAAEGSEESSDSGREYEIIAVKTMSDAMREKLGFTDAEYDRKRYYVRYTLGFEAKLRAADDEIKERYKAFADEVGLYKGLKIKDSFKQQRICKGNKTLGLILFRGKTLCVAFALNPADYAETKYRGIDKSDKKRFAKTPMLFKLTSARKLEYAKYLLVQIADANTIVMADQPAKREYDLSPKSRDTLFVEKKVQLHIMGEAPELDDSELLALIEEQAAASALPEPEIVPEPVEEIPEFEIIPEPEPEISEEQPAEEIIEPEELPEDEPEEEEPEEEEEIPDIEAEEEETEEVIIAAADGAEEVQRIRYNRSFTARIVQSDSLVKARYSELKNELLSYKGVKSNISWKRESFRLGRNTFACFVVRGKTLCLCLATDPHRFDGTKYKVIDLTVRSPKSKQPCMYRIKSERRVKYAKQIIAMLMQEYGVAAVDNFEAQSYVMPYRGTQQLLDEGLIRIVGEKSEGTPELQIPAEIPEPVEEIPEPEIVSEPEPIPEPEISEEQPAEEITEPEIVPEVEPEELPEDEPEEEEPEEEEEIPDIEAEEEETEEVIIAAADGAEEVQRIRYNRSFTARIVQADSLVKARYSELKNELLSYKGVKSNISWKRESFRLGRNTFACFVVRGKTLCLCLATDPHRFDGTKYKVIDLTVRSPKSKQPCMYRIKSERRVKYAKQIIAMLMQEYGVAAVDNFEAQSYIMPYRGTQQLLDEGLIRIVGEKSEGTPELQIPAEPIEEPVEKIPEPVEELVEEIPEEQPAEPIPEPVEEPVEEVLPERDFEILQEVDVAEADVMSDEQAELIVEERIIRRQKPAAKKKGIVNIDTLSSNFGAGEHVTVEKLRAKKLVGGDVTYIKVLAKGTLNKPLIVEADDFSLQAVKMIALTGGRVIRTKFN